MSKNKEFSYCFRVYDYEQYLHDVSELRAMGYTVDEQHSNWNIQEQPNFRGLFLHVDSDGDVCLYTHTLYAEVVRKLEYIINELPVIKNISSKAV